MRFNLLDTRYSISKELGARYISGVGLEIMLWNWHLQLTRRG